MMRIAMTLTLVAFAACGKSEAPPATSAAPAPQPSASPDAGDPVLRALPMPQKYPDPRSVRRDGGEPPP